MRLPSVATLEFWELYRGLPAVVRTLARKNYQLWQNNTFHPSVRFKRLGGGNWSARVGNHYRAVGKFSGAVFVWQWRSVVFPFSICCTLAVGSQHFMVFCEAMSEVFKPR